MISRRQGMSALGGSVLAALLPAFAQSGKVPRIVYMSVRSGTESRDAAFRKALRDLGYVEGKNIQIEYRYGHDNPARIPQFAAELKELKPDVIVAAGPLISRALKDGGVTTPVVMGFDIDPVGSGFAGSLAHPGGNFTGLSNLAPEIVGKQLELLKEMLPRLTRVAAIGSSGDTLSLKALEFAAAKSGIKVQYVKVLAPKDIESAMQTATKGRADAAVVLVSGNVLLAHRKQILEYAARHRLPMMHAGREYVEEGGLMTYSVNYDDLFRRAATYVDKILKGAKPSDLPIEQPTVFDLVINLKTAKTLGLKIPQTVLLQATRVIE